MRALKGMWNLVGRGGEPGGSFVLLSKPSNGKTRQTGRHMCGVRPSAVRVCGNTGIGGWNGEHESRQADDAA
jgi:hypothetical protein